MSTINNTVDQSATGGIPTQLPMQHPCPACGYCPHCGRGGYRMIPDRMVPVYPIYPYNPYYPPPIITITTTAFDTGAGGIYQ